ncbi:MAG: hypothetical protein KDA76_08335 [Planctomycetaceae bacterium]|nr:hypothetical protein [Planctomycetaceae bacterium]
MNSISEVVPYHSDFPAKSIRFGSTVLTIVVLLCGSTGPVSGAPPLDFESPPISYSEAKPENVITELQSRLDQGELILPYEERTGYLRGVLKHLDVPESSQMLTFLKSSLQRPLIQPDNARALYFGDDCYVGYVPGGKIELIVPDEKLGMVFYTLDQNPESPRFERQVASCMTCHASSRTKSIPGLQVRSMLTDPDGQPVLSAGSFRTDHSTPFEKRWGGWFVSGTHGEARHRGNFQLPDGKRPQQPPENVGGLNVTDLSHLTDLSKHLTPHSDLVALMVLEHQIDAHNLMVRTNYAWQIDVHQQREGAAEARWKEEADQLVRHLLYADEFRIEYPVAGTSSFARDFAMQGPDDAGRVLRQLNLRDRLFELPVSYTVRSRLFTALPFEVRNYVMSQIEHELLEKAKRPETGESFRSDLEQLIKKLPVLILDRQES